MAPLLPILLPITLFSGLYGLKDSDSLGDHCRFLAVLFKEFGDIVVLTLHEVPVSVHGHLDRTMSETCLYLLWMNTMLNEDESVCVT